ncbi:NAD(P)H-hydrate dehydratase [Fervidibacillus halotolerans]|uniref:Bifunctional NAD(P)H-hydrate repair enzyme n=1 Tax=Fervidibacillus halotolerans TaxID=2980027 RepID=A0A9E8RY04_9BACI|nr:NAD(P)H-hydrate dehydratase [Fervidibacillus halotolerans]WAA13305.1 NAD(P)H-hydrate dehydratase [Fervidibacillus halotolerans]
MYIYREGDIRKIDTEAMEHGLQVNTLMENAGRGLFEKIKKHVHKNMSILILAGKGNNGGDGIVLARYLNLNGYKVDLVFPFGMPASVTAAEHFRFYKNLGFPFSTSIDLEKHYDVIIDSLLGIGTRLPLNESYVHCINWCNEQSSLRIAVDLPTGVLADQGNTEIAFQADYTYALHGFKPSAFLLPSGNYYGKTEVVDIGLPHASKWKLWDRTDVATTLSDRSTFSHKGSFGTGLLLAGSDEMPGSALLAGLGAMRTGIGKLVIGTSNFVASIISTRLPEATYWFDGLQKCAKGQLIQGVRAAAIGPGLNAPYLVEEAINCLWERDIPLLLDAGALMERNYTPREKPVVITPHPGEFSRMTGKSIEEIQSNRIQLASEYAINNQMIVVLKGTYTVIAYPDGTGVINTTGNHCLAKGGSGDTLTGMLLALLCTETDIKSAVANGVYLHGACADEIVKRKDARAVSISELTDVLGSVIQKLTVSHQ